MTPDKINNEPREYNCDPMLMCGQIDSEDTTITAPENSINQAIKDQRLDEVAHLANGLCEKLRIFGRTSNEVATALIQLEVALIRHSRA